MYVVLCFVVLTVVWHDKRVTWTPGMSQSSAFFPHGREGGRTAGSLIAYAARMNCYRDPMDFAAATALWDEFVWASDEEW